MAPKVQVREVEMNVRFARHAGLVLRILGFLLVGRGLWELAGGRIYQAWRGRQVDRILENPQPRRRDGTPPRISYRAGSPIGRLEIPRLGLSVVVLEGSDSGTLRLGVGRLADSSLPGEPGNVVLAGHRDTFFRSLRAIRAGDRIFLRTAQGTFPYTVGWTKVVSPEDTEVLRPTSAPALTLVTCYPFYYVGPAPERFIVRAQPPAATPPAAVPPAPIPAASAAMVGDAPRRTPAKGRVAAAVPLAPPRPVSVAGEPPPPTVVPQPPAMAWQPQPAAAELSLPVAAAPDPPASPTKHGLARLDPRSPFHRLARVLKPRRATLR
jgi:LPXTG-site transpeptidase (sortase) family protein